MKVLIVDTVDPALPEGLSRLGLTVEEDYISSAEIISQKIAEMDGLIIRSKFPVDRTFLSKAGNLKFIGRVGAGLENIDLDCAAERGIRVFSAPEGNRNAVGEHAMGMLLALMNNLTRADHEVRNGQWRREANRGRELQGKTVGIIGCGQMGSAFAEKLEGFGVHILAYDKYKVNLKNPGIDQVELERLQAEADIISFHVPQTAETIYYLDDAFIEAMEKPFYLINTARGKVVKTSSLVKGLKNGKILGACLDVLEYEKTSFENMFLQNMPDDFNYLVHSDKVLLTPHIAGWTFESNTKMAKVLVEKIAKYLRDDKY